jgi:hypothetical protein
MPCGGRPSLGRPAWAARATSPGSRMLVADANDRGGASGLLRSTSSRGLTDTRVVGSGPGPLRCATHRAGSSAPRHDRPHELDHGTTERVSGDHDTSRGHGHQRPEGVAAVRRPAVPLLRALREPDRPSLETPAGRASDVRVLSRLRVRPLLGSGRRSVPRMRRQRRRAGYRTHRATAQPDGQRAATRPTQAHGGGCRGRLGPGRPVGLRVSIPTDRRR